MTSTWKFPLVQTTKVLFIKNILTWRLFTRSYLSFSLVRPRIGTLLCLESCRSDLNLHYNIVCLWMLSPPRQNSILLKGRLGFIKLTMDFQSFVLLAVSGSIRQVGISASPVSAEAVLFPISSLSQSSYWMSWPSSRTNMLCGWMGKFFRTLLLRISKSSGKERFIWLFKLPNH